jgi:hypothetical protein
MKLALLLALGATAHAEPMPMEIGVFAGGFVANYYHQFYDDTLYTAATRPRLGSVDPEFGARTTYFLTDHVGLEAEASVIAARVVDVPSIASIYNLRVQLVAQLPGVVSPFVDLGIGLAHLSSDTDVLGNDTDFPIHAGVGVRWYVADGLALRIDARLWRGPSSKDPYTLDASYCDFTVGLCWHHGR